MSVYLCGFMGCGKSHIGRMLAKALSMNFIDLDKYIVNAEKMTIPEIFDKFGEPHFRELEAKYIRELANSTELPVFLYEFPGFQPHIISGKAYGELTKDGLIWGIKDTTCTIDGIQSKIDNKGDSTIIQANMPYLWDAYVAGARGVMATPTSCGGAFFQRFHEAFVSGDMALAEQRYNEIILLDNAIDNGFCASAKELIRLQGIKNFNWYTRGNHNLSGARLRSLKSFHDWCVANGLMK